MSSEWLFLSDLQLKAPKYIIKKLEPVNVDSFCEEVA